MPPIAGTSQGMPERIVTQVGAHQLTLSHLDKPMWPNFSKAEAINYYLRIAEVLIPHVRRRPASFLRCPAGLEGPRFFTHTADTLHLPSWIATAAKGGRMHVALNDPETLIAVVNAYCLEIHTPQWTAETGPDVHDRLVFDLDPGEDADLATCCRVALLLRRELEADGLTVFPATSGGKGLHLTVPLNPPWLADDAIGYARDIARRMADTHRDSTTYKRGPAARAGGKVLIDWEQNRSSATTSALYALRLTQSYPGVSTPLAWREVQSGDPAALTFTPANVLERVSRLGDLGASAI